MFRSSIRWRVGNGVSINVWRELWIPGQISFLHPTGFDGGSPDLLVADFICQSSSSWNYELLSLFFEENLIKQIVAIPIIPSLPPDLRIWSHTPNGIFSVRSAYHFLMTSQTSTIELPTWDWGRLWRIKSQPKYIHFLWRACKNVLPTRDNLIKRGVQIDGICPFCSNEETVRHILIDCSFARDFWELGGWSVAEHRGSIESLVFHKVLHWDNNRIHQFCVLVWSLWRNRNRKVWQHANDTPQMVYNGAINFFGDYAVANPMGSRRPTVGLPCPKWQRPQLGTVKCNIDAAFDSERLQGSYAAVIRDYEGVWLGALCGPISGCADPFQAELQALMKAQQWLDDWTIGPVVFELDAKKVVVTIQSPWEDRTEAGVLLNQCRRFFQTHVEWHIAWSPRICNNLAHVLARFALTCTSLCFFPEALDFCSEAMSQDA